MRVIIIEAANKGWNTIKKHHYHITITVIVLIGIYILLDECGILDTLFVINPFFAGSQAFAFWLFGKNEEKSEEAQKLTIDQQEQDFDAEENCFWENHEAKELESTGQDSASEENTHFWESLAAIKYILLDQESTEAEKAAAIHRTVPFYTPEHIKFSIHIHTFFKDFLEEFWKNNADSENISALPNCIKIIYDIIKHQSHKEKDGKKFFEKNNGLSFVDFQLKSARFDYIDFYNANLIHANLDNADLNNANLVSSDLANVNLIKADLTDANLTEANLTEADLTDSTIQHANLSSANVKGASLVRSNFPRADLNRADFTKTNSSCADFTKADLNHVLMSYANLTKTNLSSVNLIGANLSFANLASANLNFANLSFADLAQADLSETDLTSANLTGVDLKTVKNLTKAKLKNAMYCEDEHFVTQFPDGFDPKANEMQLVNKYGDTIKNKVLK